MEFTLYALVEIYFLYIFAVVMFNPWMSIPCKTVSFVTIYVVKGSNLVHVHTYIYVQLNKFIQMNVYFTISRVVLST